MDILIVLVVILIVLGFLGTAYAVTRSVLRAEHTPTPAPAHPRPVWAAPPSRGKPGSGSQPGPAWGALDDLQLTRLLTDSAPPPTSND